MESRASKTNGWLSFSGTVLLIAGLLAAVDGLLAVSRATFFAYDATFVFSDLATWGWIVFGLGALSIASGLAVFTGAPWARWTGLIIAGLGALGQVLFTPAFALGTVVIASIYMLTFYGLFVHGGKEMAATSTVADTGRGGRRSRDAMATIAAVPPPGVEERRHAERRVAERRAA